MSNPQEELEKEILARISTAKAQWEVLKQLADDGWKKNVLFVHNHLQDLFTSFEKELNQLRIELCRLRKE